MAKDMFSLSANIQMQLNVIEKLLLIIKAKEKL